MLTEKLNNTIKTCGNLTLKAAKAEFTKIKLSSSLKEKAKLVTSSKTKVLFINGVGIIIEALAQETDTDNDTNTKLSEELTTISLEVKGYIKDIQKTTFKVGNLLVEAKQLHTNSKKTQKEFLAWAKEACNLGKAQVYKLMKVFTIFGAESDFCHVSSEVLYWLTSQDKEIVDKCRVLAIKNKLTTGVMFKIQKEQQKSLEPDTNKPETKTDNDKMPEMEYSNQSLEKLAPANNSETNTKTLETETNKDKDTIKALQATIIELRETLKNLTDKKVKESVKVPYLPQFDSKDLCTVLGLESEFKANKTKINTAYRALAKIYTPVTNKQASVKLSKARNSLISKIKGK